MLTKRLSNIGAGNSKSLGMLFPVILLWAVMLILGFFLIWLNDGFAGSLNEYYLLPWCFVAGVVVLAPSFYLFVKGRFDPFHPLVFAAWSYIFPAFVLGGVIVSFKLVDPYFLTFIEDPKYNLPLSLVYIAVGFLGMTVGFALPIGRFFAEKVEPRLPRWNWQPEKVWLPGTLLLLIGVGFNVLGFIQGILGFQRNIEVNVLDGTLFFVLIILTEGTVLLWLGIFTTKVRNGIFYIMCALLILFLPLRMAVIGSRSGLIVGLLPIAMAFVYSGRKIKMKTGVLLGIVGVLAVIVGATYGTTFRNIKGSESRMDAGDYFGQVGATVAYLSNADPGVVVSSSAQALADRIDNLSSVAVVVSNYERLAPFEASYGIENNITNDLYTSFIPRVLWNEKPPTSDARAYSDLYFNYSENSFAISPFADLLRNFGPIGVPIGMLLLGIYLRFIYAALIETPNPAMWKKTAYFLLLTVISYESFYATIFPSIIRTVVVIAVSLFLANLLARKAKQSELPKSI